MKIKWLGHSCFLLTSNTGIRIITDPFNEEVGYPLPKTAADIVTTSHDHYDHGNVDVVSGYSVHVKDPGTYNCKGIDVKGVATFHDENGGKLRGKNTVFTFTIDGIRVCHLGDLGHTLSEQQIGEIGRIDVLLVPVGGIYTIDGTTAVKVVNSLSPAISIPMHYQTEYLSLKLDGVENFLSLMPGERLDSSELTINKEELTGFSKVIVLDYP